MRWIKASEPFPEIVDKKASPRFVKVERQKYDKSGTWIQRQTAYYFPDRFKTVEWEDWDDYSQEDFPYTEEDTEKGCVWLRAGWYASIDCDKCEGYWSSPLNVVEWLDEELPADDMTTTFQNEPVNFLLSNALRHLTQDQQRQLCHALLERLPSPASLEQEAERLYLPDPEKNYLYGQSEIIAAKRSAHINAARQYMGEIERLTRENEKMRKALKAILKRCGDSGNDYGQAVYEISEMSYEAIKIDFNF